MFKASAKTAKMTLRRKKEPIMISETEKTIAIQVMLESIKLYITRVQCSRVIIWKMVSMAHAKLSKPRTP